MSFPMLGFIPQPSLHTNTKLGIAENAMEHETSEKARMVAEVNSLLAAAVERGARWWQYTASLSTFELVVGKPDSTSNLVLVLPSCTFVSGPVAWSPQRLSVRMEQPQATESSAVFELRDDAAGFVARSNMFTFKQGWNLLELGSVMFPHDWRSSS